MQFDSPQSSPRGACKTKPSRRSRHVETNSRQRRLLPLPGTLCDGLTVIVEHLSFGQSLPKLLDIHAKMPVLCLAGIQDSDVQSNVRGFWDHKAHLPALRGELFIGPGIFPEALAFALCPSQLLKGRSFFRPEETCALQRPKADASCHTGEHLNPKTSLTKIDKTYLAKTPPAHATFSNQT